MADYVQYKNPKNLYQLHYKTEFTVNGNSGNIPTKPGQTFTFQHTFDYGNAATYYGCDSFVSSLFTYKDPNTSETKKLEYTAYDERDSWTEPDVPLEAVIEGNGGIKEGGVGYKYKDTTLPSQPSFNFPRTVKRGSFPQFNYYTSDKCLRLFGNDAPAGADLWGTTYNGNWANVPDRYYRIKKATNSGIEIYESNKSWSLVNLIATLKITTADGSTIIPNRILLHMQAAGGGGGGVPEARTSGGGGGGGAGGCASVVINTDYDWYLRIGTAGYGGWGGDKGDYSYARNSTYGNATCISSTSSTGQDSTADAFCWCGGGHAGGVPSGDDLKNAGSMGVGGDISCKENANKLWVISKYQGNFGGTGGRGQSPTPNAGTNGSDWGDRYTGQYLYCTNNTIDRARWPNKSNGSWYLGGKGGGTDSSRGGGGGGGGASSIGAGGAGADYNNHATDGVGNGAGGGGAGGASRGLLQSKEPAHYGKNGGIAEVRIFWDSY